MSTTISLQSVINLCSTHVDLLPLSGVGGYTNEPALSLCNDALSEIISAEHDWKWNEVELGATVQPLVTASNKQDYLFAGASAFTLGSTSTGAPIGLSSNNAITVATGVVTVSTLEPHRFNVGDTVYMLGVTMSTGTTSKYNSVFTDNGSTTTYSGGWVITAVTSTSFSFAATSGQNNADAGGAPGISDFGWLSGATMSVINNNSSPQDTKHIETVRKLPVWSKVGDPEKVSVQQDLTTGVIKVRFYYVPGTTIFAVNLIYQKQAPVKTALTNTWAPIPDHLSAMYRQALIYRMYRYLNSPQQNAEYQKLQQEINKAKGFDNNETSNVYMTPEPLLDLPLYYSGF